MKRVKISPRKKLQLEQLHANTRDRKQGDRIKAVLLRSEGWTVQMISQALRIHETTVSRHINDYQIGKFNIASGGSDSALDEKQTQQLISHLQDHTYQSTKEIIVHVRTTFGITYSVPGMNKWLHRNGFSYKKPKGYPHKASAEQQGQFRQEYEDLKANLKEDEAMMFMDSVHPSQATKVTHGWIKKGQDKPIATTASRTRLNIIGALSIGEAEKTMINSYETVNGESIVHFITRLRNKSKKTGKIYLILDGAGYHRTEIVKDAAQRLNIQLVYLPAYSPNLNPIEQLWKLMNEFSRNNKFFHSAQEFRECIMNFFKKTLRKIKGIANTRITDNFQQLNHAF
jgi:transposase